MNPRRLFLFNSGLPEACRGPEWLTQDMGWNIGNGYISYALLNVLFGAPVRVAHVRNAWIDPLPDALVDEINSGYTHVLFVIQDVLREGMRSPPFDFDRITRFLERIRIPIVPVSLGANCVAGYDGQLASRLTSAQKRFVAVLADKSVSLGVRGSYTAEVLATLGIKNVEVIGCPSYYGAGPLREITRRPWNPERVVTTGSFFNTYLPRSVHVLQDETFFIETLFLQKDRSAESAPERPKAGWDPWWGPTDALTPRESPDPFPFGRFSLPRSFHLYQKAILGLLRFFPDFCAWERFYDDGDFCLTIGDRLHSAILSCNRGVPAIVTNADARSRESCELFQLPYRPDLDVRSDLRAVFEALDWSAPNQTYGSRFANFLAFLKAHGLTPNTDASTDEHFAFLPVEQNPTGITVDRLHSGFLELTEYVKCMARWTEESRTRCVELLGFQNSTAGQIAVRLQELAHRHPRARKALRTILSWLPRG